MNKVLLIEDDVDLRECFRDIFLSRGYKVSEASNGKEALYLVALDEPDLIITDIEMPEMNGVEFLKKFRETNSNTPVVVMTGGDKFSEDYVLGLGANLFLHKSNDIELIYQTISTTGLLNLLK